MVPQEVGNIRCGVAVLERVSRGFSACRWLPDGQARSSQCDLSVPNDRLNSAAAVGRRETASPHLHSLTKRSLPQQCKLINGLDEVVVVQFGATGRDAETNGNPRRKRGNLFPPRLRFGFPDESPNCITTDEVAARQPWSPSGIFLPRGAHSSCGCRCEIGLEKPHPSGNFKLATLSGARQMTVRRPQGTSPMPSTLDPKVVSGTALAAGFWRET